MNRRTFIGSYLAGIGGASAWRRGMKKNTTEAGSCEIGSPASEASGSVPRDAKGAASGAITMLFGVQDTASSRWDGTIKISGGTVLQIRGHHFGKEDEIIDGSGWKASTKNWLPSVATGDLNPTEEARPHATRVKPVGVTIHYKGPETAKLHVKINGAHYHYPVTKVAGSAEAPFLDTPSKEFKFRIKDVPNSGTLYLLDSRVQVFRVPVVDLVSEGDHETDYPAMVQDRANNLWLAWVSYHNLKENVCVKRFGGGSWSEVMTATPQPSEIASCAMAVDGKNRIWVVWSEHQGSDWHLMARCHDQTSWSEVRQLTRGRGNNLFPRLTADQQGNLHLVWQGIRGSGSKIFLKSMQGGAWSGEIEVSAWEDGERVNHWSPDVVADRADTVWVAWDSYVNGSYNILLRSVKKGRAGGLLRVTDSARFHAHANLAVDQQNRLWIAYDTADENWGKDVGYDFGGGTNLYQSRKVQFAIRSGNQWLQPRSDLVEALPYGARGFTQLPRLVPDGKGVWAVFRSRTEAEVPMTHFAWGARWELMASYYSGDRWSRPVPIPDSQIDHNQESPFAGVIDGKGQLLVAFAGNVQRPIEQSNSPLPLVPPGQGIRLSRFLFSQSETGELGVRAAEPPARKPVEPFETDDVAAVRNYAIHLKGKTYKIYRGDMHRHTEISGDGGGDGSLWDAYRYALDAASLDFFAVTDHMAGFSEYTWWRTQKSSDMFHMPGVLLPLFGYERSIGYPNGHRNVVTARRGVRILPIAPGENLGRGGNVAQALIKAEEAMIAGQAPSWADQEIVRSDKILYPYLRQNGAIAMAHTPVNMVMGTDWGGESGTITIDPELEPLVEIFQGARISSEHEGAPLAPSKDNPELQHGEAGGYQRLGWIWNAWKKGYKLGVQSSSDHTSTHCSYTFVLAEEGTREGMMNGMRRRHTYAGTTNIILDFRLKNETEEYLMGDELVSRVIPTLRVKARGAGPIARVHVIRDNQYGHLERGAGAQIEFTYRDKVLAPGEHYYYVRLEQEDGNVAWASPIWVKYLA